MEKGSTQAEYLAGRLPHYAPHDEILSRLEAEAMAAKRGLWSMPNPISPWEWRRGAKETLPAALEGTVIGNKKSKAYHEPTCENAASISPAHRVQFNSAAAAREAGYRPGKDCHPR